MKTREKILATALQLFNEQGLNQVSAKTIAAHMGISDGNLRYHFRTKQDIVYGLYITLVEQLDREFDQYEEEVRLVDVFQSLYFTFVQFTKYRFLLLDFTGVMRQYPTIRTHYQGLYRVRQQQFSEVVRKLVDAGIFRQDIGQQQYEHLGVHFNIISDFWLSHAEILHSEDVVDQLPHFTRLTFSLVFPYLTEAGQLAYQSLRDYPLSRAPLR